MVVLDTCAMIELLKSSPSFTAKTYHQMDECACILSISFAEIACKVKMNKLSLNISVRDLYNKFCQIKHIEIIDIGVDHWLSSIDLEWPKNKDPADRIITSFAMENNLAIVTNDKQIEKYYHRVIW